MLKKTKKGLTQSPFPELNLRPCDLELKFDEKTQGNCVFICSYLLANPSDVEGHGLNSTKDFKSAKLIFNLLKNFFIIFCM
jgi:hypothetical protein